MLSRLLVLQQPHPFGPFSLDAVADSQRFVPQSLWDSNSAT